MTWVSTEAEVLAQPSMILRGNGVLPDYARCDISSRTDQIDTYSTILPVGADFGTHGWLVVIAIDHRH